VHEMTPTDSGPFRVIGGAGRDREDRRKGLKVLGRKLHVLGLWEGWESRGMVITLKM
jgi:hypothetical protein